MTILAQLMAWDGQGHPASPAGLGRLRPSRADPQPKAAGAASSRRAARDGAG